MSSTSRRRALMRSEQPVRQLRVAADPLEKAPPADQLDLELRGGAHRGAARAPVEHAHLAEELAFLGGAEQDAVVADLAQHLGVAGAHQHHVIARIALAEQDVAGLEALEQVHRLADRRPVCASLPCRRAAFNSHAGAAGAAPARPATSQTCERRYLPGAVRGQRCKGVRRPWRPSPSSTSPSCRAGTRPWARIAPRTAPTTSPWASGARTSTPPFVGVVTTWNEAAPVQHRARAPGAGGQARRGQGRRHAARVHHDHRDRRHRHGPSGHEELAGLARGDRRLDRAHDARPRLRRAGRPRRLRQVAARPDDGHGAPQRARRCSCTAAASCPAGSRAGT